MMFTFIDRAKKIFPAHASVHRMCQLLGVSQSGYYAWQDRPESSHSRMDRVLRTHIRSAFAYSNDTYGSPCMVYELRDQGFYVGRRRIARLMLCDRMA